MENTNSNKPLSAHELLHLIKLKSSEQPIDQDLDDFEKEALEGFVSYSSMDAFTKLNIDVQLEISKKVSEKTFFKNRNTFIFSAAASIVLIVLISLFYVIDTNKNSSSELALNNQSRQESPINQLKDDLEKVDQDKIPLKNNKPKQVTDSADEVLFKTDTKKSEIPIRIESSQTTNDAATKIVSNKDDSKSTETISGETVSQSYNYIEKQQIASSDLSLDHIAVENDDGNVSNTKSLSENKKEKVAITTMAKKSNNQLTTTPNTTEPKASFAGGEVGIKNYVLANAKKDDVETKLKGSYKIKILIKPDGSSKVLKINSISNGEMKTINKISKILNTMKNWNPEMDNGKAVLSDKEFVLEF